MRKLRCQSCDSNQWVSKLRLAMFLGARPRLVGAAGRRAVGRGRLRHGLGLLHGLDYESIG